MAVMGFKKNECVSVFDPALNAYHEVPIAHIEKQLESFGFTPEEIKTRVDNLKAKKGEE